MMCTYSESSIFSPSTQIFSDFSHLFRRLSELSFASSLPITSSIAMIYTYSESSIYSPPTQLFSDVLQFKHMYRYLQVSVDKNMCKSTSIDFVVRGTCVKVAGTCKNALMKISKVSAHLKILTSTCKYS